ncbi:MAG: hypothetical protein ACT4O5_12190 [Gammaproteobacteria bacterium]
MKVKYLCLAAVLAAPLTANAADDIDNLVALAQSEFTGLAEDLGATLSYKPLTPAEPLGITGFDIGIAATGTRLEHVAAFDQASSSSDFPSTAPVPSVRIHKGLPLNIDVGLMYSTVPDTNLRSWGGELRYAVVGGNVALPAIGIRAAYTKLTGVDQLDFDTRSVDVSISKGFAIFTPYAGVGRVWASATPDASTGLSAVSPSLNKVFIGGNLNFGLLNLAVEADRTGDADSYGVKVGFRL